MRERYSTDWTELSFEPDEDTLTRSEALARPMEFDEPEPYRPTLSLARLEEPWRDRAACEGMGCDLFFPEPTAIPGVQGWRTSYDAAKVICDRCPVRQECLEEALRYHEAHGMWGGLTPRQRKTEISRRGGERARVCHVCDVEFLAAGNAFYCDEACRSTARRRQVAESKRRTA